MALIIALIGSPFLSGGYFNPANPNIVVGGQLSQPNTQYGNGDFATSVYIENKGKNKTLVSAYIILIDTDGNNLKILNSETGDTVTHLFIQGGAKTQLVATSDKRAAHLIFCTNARLEGPWTSSEYHSAYSLMNITPNPDLFLNYKTANRSKFETHISSCTEKLKKDTADEAGVSF